MSNATTPSFNQIQEALHLVRAQSGLPQEVIDGVIAPALRHYCDFHHPSEPSAMAQVFWDADGETGHGSAEDVVKGLV